MQRSAILAPLAALLLACGGGEGGDSSPGNPAAAGRKLVSAKCSLCHSLSEHRGPLAPTLGEAVATARTWTANYGERVESLREAAPGHHDAQLSVLEGILAIEGQDERFTAWLDAYLQDPKFDDPSSKMQKVVLSPLEREQIIAHILTLP